MKIPRWKVWLAKVIWVAIYLPNAIQYAWWGVRNGHDDWAKEWHDIFDDAP